MNSGNNGSLPGDEFLGSDLQLTCSNTSPERTQPQPEQGISTAPTDSSPPRRARGRPPGSKNKAKPPILVSRENPNVLKPHFLEVSSGADIFESLMNYATRRGQGVCILSANGSVTNVRLRQADAPPGTVLVINGRFEIVSLTGTALPPPAPARVSGLTLHLSRGQGQIVGGRVAGQLTASGPVLLVVASFALAGYDLLPLEENAQLAPEHRPASQSSEVTGEGTGNYPFPTGFFRPPF